MEKFMNCRCGTQAARIISRWFEKFIMKNVIFCWFAIPSWIMTRLEMSEEKWDKSAEEKVDKYYFEFLTLSQWHREVKKSMPHVPIIIVANKKDLRHDRVSLMRLDRLQNLKPIETAEGRNLAKSLSTGYVECSPMLGVSWILFSCFLSNWGFNTCIGINRRVWGTFLTRLSKVIQILHNGTNVLAFFCKMKFFAQNWMWKESEREKLNNSNKIFEFTQILKGIGFFFR